MILILHGISATKILAILSIHYVASTSSKPRLLSAVWPFMLFAGNMGVLFLNERYDGYKLGELHAIFDSLVRCLILLGMADDDDSDVGCIWRRTT